MISILKQDEFLHKYNIAQQQWDECGISWAALKDIGIAHESNEKSLEDAAVTIAKTIQKFPKVHSVRWRVKDPEHLMAKIVRKVIKKSNKYEGMNPQNYNSIVKDLIGIRVLHLYKEDTFSIHASIVGKFRLDEKPIIYFRDGDDESLGQRFRDAGLVYEKHLDGYRSAHYIIRVNVVEEYFAEVQVRTIFEEGWSEIDHSIRYPHHSDNVLLRDGLVMFNRMVGSADEMGAYLRRIADDLESRRLPASIPADQSDIPAGAQLDQAEGGRAAQDGIAITSTPSADVARRHDRTLHDAGLPPTPYQSLFEGLRDTSGYATLLNNVENMKNMYGLVDVREQVKKLNNADAIMKILAQSEAGDLSERKKILKQVEYLRNNDEINKLVENIEKSNLVSRRDDLISGLSGLKNSDDVDRIVKAAKDVNELDKYKETLLGLKDIDNHRYIDKILKDIDRR